MAERTDPRIREAAQGIGTVSSSTIRLAEPSIVPEAATES